MATQGVSDTLAARALFELQKVAHDTSKSLYVRNHAVYRLLRYGVKVRPEAGENTVTVWLVKWADPLANDFAVTEEVSVPGGDLVSGAKASTKRPDVVLYVNGIARTRSRVGPLVPRAAQGCGHADVHDLAGQARRSGERLGRQADEDEVGSCTPASRRVWLNSELAKKPIECIGYIVVHELLHLAEPNHGERFVALMNRHLPRWVAMQKRLNAAPLGHEDWDA